MKDVKSSDVDNRLEGMRDVNHALANLQLDCERKKQKIGDIETVIQSAETEVKETLKRTNELVVKIESSHKAYTEYVDKLNGLQDHVRDQIDLIKKNYEDQMRMAEPAKVWKSQVRHYWICGAIYVTVGVILCIAFGCLLFSLLTNADVFPVFNVTKFDFSTVRASIVLLLFSSIFGYIIHLMFKMAISSFHLSRDANERVQLTNYYLSLMKMQDAASTFDEKSKRIMVHAIFERSDSGLLKGGDGSVNQISVGDLFSKE